MKTKIVKSGKVEKDELLLEEFGIEHKSYSQFVIIAGLENGKFKYAVGFGANFEDAKNDAELVLKGLFQCK